MSPSSKWTPLVGRILISIIFLLSGLGKIGNFAGTAAEMAAKGVPATSLLLVGAIAFEILGALSLILGLKARWGAIALLVFLVPASLLFHDFWAYEGQEQRLQMIHFLKNVAIAGGLVMVLHVGPGPLSLDAKMTAAGR